MAEPTRRMLLAASALVWTGGTGVMAADKDKLAWDFSFPGIEGGTIDFAAFKGRVLLVANTASFCGYTYQYEALQKLYDARKSAGLVVIGVPSQDFNQESADNKTVKDFCETRFGIDFPMTGLAHVRGAQAAPFYAWVNSQRLWHPNWNFNKVLIGRDGRILGTFGSSDEPNGAALTKAIDQALAAAV
ncbi:MAG: glutathione peroxidase [Proteobacteria bacterium]|nr:glutathione peroxidase [Pseudomonadota bacterium]